MFEFLAKIFSSLSATTQKYSAEAIATQITEFRRLINVDEAEYKIIRLWVDAGASYGHQSSSVNLMYRLARPADANNLTFGYKGTIELYYQEVDEKAKLKELIPETSGDEPYKVNDATIKLIRYTAKPVSHQVAIGMTGGAAVDQKYTDALNVKYFLRLQPFNWPGAEQIEFADNTPTVNLLEVPEVGAASFKRRLYTMDPAGYQAPPWETYLAGNYSAPDKEKLKIVRHLVSQDVLDSFALQTVYSIKTGSPRFNQDTAFGAAIIAGAALEWQTKRSSSGSAPAYLSKKAKPVVIVNFDLFGTKEVSAESDLREVLEGGFGPNELGFKLKVDKKDPNAIANYNRRKAFFETLGSKERFFYLNYPETLQAVTDKLRKIRTGSDPKSRVLFIQLGRSFPAIFSSAIFRSTLPPIFEGQNTANLCVNIGRTYVQIPGTKDTDAERLKLYPAVTMGQYNSQAVPGALLRIASQVSRSPEVWPTRAGEAPPRLIGEYFQQYTDEPADGGTIHDYFSNLKAFFANATQDKMSVAVSYMNTLLPRDDNEDQAMAAEANPLDALYDKIAPSASKGLGVDLVPGVLVAGTIPDFIKDFLKNYGATLTLTKTTEFEPADKTVPLDKLTLKGPTSAFKAIGVECAVEVVFTAPKSVLTADIKFTAVGEWAMPGAPWMVFDRPFIALLIPNGKLPVAAQFGGFYPVLEHADPPLVAKLNIAVGGDAKYWPAGMHFEGAYPGIAGAYQLLTGYNVIQSLPAPFNVVADLGLSDIEVEYDYKAKNVNSLAAVARNNTEDLPLFGDLSLHNIVVTALITEPTTTRKLTVSASAEFNIGKPGGTGQDEPAVAEVSIDYPDIVLKGGLKSGVLTPSKIIETFVPYIGDLMLPYEPVIDAFSFMYDKPKDYLSVSMNMTMEGWKFYFPFTSTALFSLTQVGFSISRDKGMNTGNITAHTFLFPDSAAKIGVDVGAYYQADKSWRFLARTTTMVDVNALVKAYLGDGWVADGIKFPKLKDVSATLVWGKNGNPTAKAQSFEFSAKTAEPWQPIKVMGDKLSATFDLTLGYKAGETEQPKLAASAAGGGEGPGTELMVTGKNGDQAGAYGKLSADVTLWNIHLNVKYDFDPTIKKVCVKWLDVGITACLEKNKDGDTIATFGLDGESVGSIVEKFVSWATGAKFGLVAPWNILDDIKLSGLNITYNFAKKKVDFTIGIGPIDLGLFKLTGITLAYNPDGNPTENGAKSKNKVQIKVDGSFIWHSGDSMEWEPDDPSTTPAPPGGGNKYIDLRLLALGQHVTVPGLIEEKNVQGVIEKLTNLDIPNPPDIPFGGKNQPAFDAKSSWFIAFDFGILKVEKKKDGNGDEAKAASALPDDGGGKSHALVPADDRALAMTAEEEKAQYFISLAIIFNDPYLYGLRIGLEGPMAKAFAGLDFQIMYRQVSENVGCYSAEIALPDIMRKIQVGVASITLPTFAIEIYTNGDFQVDLGFPWKENFSLSFSVEFMAGPVPVMGSAGLYFGKLSSATTDKVPQTTTGWFNPVLVFGFGAQIGLGKSIEAGILKAGFSLTVFGIIEGVIARWLPYKALTPAGNKIELQDGYYFSLTGTMGVQGRLYGSINFAIISAELNVAISIYVRITFASYEPIPITAKASVDVTLTVKINLGLFSISIHLGFHASVEATFILENPMKGPAPWAIDRDVSKMSAPARLTARGLNKGGAVHPAELVAMLAVAGDYTPVWDNLQQGTVLQLQGWVVPVLTVAGDAATTPDQQKICYVANFFLESEKPIQADEGGAIRAQSAAPGDAHVVAKTDVAHAALERARPVSAMAAGADKFEDLAIRVLQWVIAAGQPDKLTPQDVDNLVISDDFLAGALSYLSGAATPMTVDDIDKFLDLQTEFVFGLKEDARKGANGNDEPAPVVFFPAVPGITLDVPAFAGSEEYQYAFGNYNSSSAGYLDSLNDYFNQLKIQVQEEQRREALSASDAATNTGPSIATYVFGDYFAMIGRLMIQAMRDGLRNFKLVIEDYAGKTVQQIVDDINTKGNLADPQLPPEKMPDDPTILLFTVGELFVANQTHALNPAAGSALTIAAMTWQSPGGKSLDDIAKESVFKGGFDGRTLALQNADNATILAAGIKIAHGQDTYTTQGADSLNTIASKLGFVDGSDPDAAKLIAAVPTILTDPKLLAAQAILDVPPLPHKVVADDTLQTIAGQYGIDLDALASANGGVKDLFDSASDPNLNVPHLVQYQVGALIDEIRRTLALQHLSAMVSRYYLHGLRLPTRLKDGSEKLTPNANGLFVRKGGQYPEDLGLYALTGQAFPLPDIPDPSTRKPNDPKFSFSLTRGSESWLSLGVKGGTSVTYTLDDKHDNRDYLRYDGVKKVALTGFLNTQSSNIKPLEVAATKPGRYPLSREIPWQPAVAVTLPNQNVMPAAPRPRLWPLPNELINIPNGTSVHPTLKPVLARTDESKGITVDENVNNYGFGTLITFAVKKIQVIGSTGITQRTYEIIGAPESEITLLERLLDQLRDEAGTFDQVGLVYRPSTTGSEAKGWQSDDPATSLMGITQTDLSTETHPPTGAGAMAADAIKEHANLIGTPNEFLRLLWEASITRQGGFYLSYTTGIGGNIKGLPDHAFNDRGEAEVAVVALFTHGAKQGQALSNFMNVVATNEPFDLSHAALIAEAVPISVPQARIFMPEDTLATYAESYYIGIGILAAQNATIAFNANIKVTIEGGVYQVPPVSADPPTEQDPGGDLANIAKHFKTTVPEIQAANIAGNLPAKLSPFTAIKLPRIELMIGQDSGGNSFQALSNYFNTPTAKIAAANRDVAGLFPKVALTAITGPVSLAPAVKQGVAGITLQRPVPQLPDSPDGNWGDLYLQQLFGLFGYRITSNPENSYFPASNWGLPSGPINPDSDDDGDKIQAPRAAAADDTWHFTCAVPYASVLGKGEPGFSPYGGVGGILQLDFAWLDIFGNRILSEFDNPKPTAGTPLNKLPQITGYTDRLLGVGQWPSVAHAYRVIKDDSTGAPHLKIQLDFDASAYKEAAAAGGEDKIAAESGKQKLKQAIVAYTMIVQQLSDPAGVTIELTTSMTPSANWAVPDKSTADQQSLKEWAKAILTYLKALLDAPNSNPSIQREYAFQVLLHISKINTDQIFKLSTTLMLSRKRPLVAGELGTAPGVTEAATRIAPWTGPLTSNPDKSQSQPQRTLTEFAKDFTAAFASVPDVSFRVATGSDRDVFAGGGRSPLWAVQLGDRGATQPISYTIKDVGAPMVYAPRPISNVLKSKPKTPIIEYKTGTVISLDGKPEDRSFSSIDLDKWMRVTLADIDELLTPKYVSPAEILRKNIKDVTDSPSPHGWKNALQEVLDAKKHLADKLRVVMIPVYQGKSANDLQLKDIREVFYQRMLGTMGQFYTVKAGVQFEADVQAAIKQQPEAKDVPRIYGDIVMKLVEKAEASAAGEPRVEDKKKNISVSSPKLDLKFADDSKLSPSPYLSSLVSSTATDAKKVTLNLGYNGQYIEHEIGTLAGIEGYKPSSWLSFVDISPDKPSAADEEKEAPDPHEDSTLWAALGQFDVPIVLREFPDTPKLVNQEELSDLLSPCYQPITDDDHAISSSGLLLNATDCTKEGPYDPLAKATRWSYAFEYSMQVHRQQDEIHGEISFNIVDRADLTAMAAPERDLFDNLAQFTQVYPKVRTDLNTFLVPIDVGTTDSTILKNAQFALESAAAMINWLADSAKEKEELFASSTAAGVAPVKFTISEDGVKKENPDKTKVTALQVTVKLTEELPLRAGRPLVEITGYTCERIETDDPKTGIFLYKDSKEDYLQASVAKNIPGRKFVLPDMDILERQDAQTEIYLTRNADIVPGKTIAKLFVYTTPKVSFEGPLHPTLFNNDPINLATIFSTGKDKPRRRTLECQLTLFYEALFANAGTNDVTLQLGLYYEYSINDAIEKIRLPVYLMPPIKTALRAGGSGTPLITVITNQVKGWETWFKTHTPETEGGQLIFDLTVMSDLKQRPMPIFKMTGLYLPVTDLNGRENVTHRANN